LELTDLWDLCCSLPEEAPEEARDRNLRKVVGDAMARGGVAISDDDNPLGTIGRLPLEFVLAGALFSLDLA